MSGLQAPATATAAVSLFIIARMMPLVSVDAAPPKESRDADLEFLGIVQAGGEAVAPRILDQLETDKKRKEKSVTKKHRFRFEERRNEKDAGNE